jgi:hypothetical protein
MRLVILTCTRDQEGRDEILRRLGCVARRTAVCIVDEDGIVIQEGKVASEPDDLQTWIAAFGMTLTRLGLEAGPLSPWLHAGLRAAGLPAICIETRRMKGATAAMAIKTDRNDARKAWGMAVAKRCGLRRAVIAVARKLAIVMHRIWVDGTTFTWSREGVAAA